MNNSGDILLKLIEEDYGLEGKGRWFRSEEKSSLVIDHEKGIFYYNAENIVGDPMVYLTKVRKLSFKDAKEYLNKFDYSGTFVYTVTSGKEDVVVYPKLVDVFNDLGKPKDKRDYFYRRGLTDETIDRFQLGWYNNFNVVPFFEDGTFRNFQMRRDIPVKEMRPYYRGLGALLFNSDIMKLTNKIYYAEGPIDAIAVNQNGLPCISCSVPGYVNPEWFSKFTGQKEIVILYDNDKAGDNEAKRVAKVLGTHRCRIYNFWDFEEGGYDAVDFFKDGHSKDELLELIEKNSKYTFEFGDIKNEKRS